MDQDMESVVSQPEKDCETQEGPSAMLPNRELPNIPNF